MTTATFLTPARLTEEEAVQRPQDSTSAKPTSQQEGRPQRIVVEADEIVLKAGEATITLSRSHGGIIEIHAPALRLLGDQILSEATDSNTTVGRRVVSEAISVSELLGRLVRVDGQCIKIS